MTPPVPLRPEEKLDPTQFEVSLADFFTEMDGIAAAIHYQNTIPS